MTKRTIKRKITRRFCLLSFLPVVFLLDQLVREILTDYIEARIPPEERAEELQRISGGFGHEDREFYRLNFYEWRGAHLRVRLEVAALFVLFFREVSVTVLKHQGFRKAEEAVLRLLHEHGFRTIEDISHSGDHVMEYRIYPPIEGANN